MNIFKHSLMLALMLALAAGSVPAATTVSESRPLDPDGRVEISNVAGAVEVVGWTGDGVEITGTLDDNVEELDISSGGSRLHIEAVVRRGARKGGSAHLTVKVPNGASIEVETVSADISVDGVRGEVDLESVSGHVEVTGQPMSLQAVSVSGDILVGATGGRAQLESVSGDIVVREARGRLEADVVSGKIVVEGGLLDGFDAETVSGSVYCAALPTDRARYSMESMSGTVELVVAPDIDADFSIETYSGSIKNEIGPEPVRTEGYGPGKELRFRSGAGGPRITVESFSGSVRLRTQ